jgi:hypothetical protein
MTSDYDIVFLPPGTKPEMGKGVCEADTYQYLGEKVT